MGGSDARVWVSAGDLPVNERSDDDGEEEEEEEEEEDDEEHQQCEEGPIHDFGDSDDSEDDTADPNQVLSFVGAAQAPSGYTILESCLSLETHEDMQNLIGKQILHDWDDKDR